MRFVVSTALLLLAACGQAEDPGSNCCAIEPRAKCEGFLSASGVTPDEEKIVSEAGRHLCPSAQLSEARIREIAGLFREESCRGVNSDVLMGLESGYCRSSYATLTDDWKPPLGIDRAAVIACGDGLTKRGLQPNELWLMMHEPEGICPNNGVDEPRIREILDKDWEQAGCKHYSKADMLRALDTGRCGGDAG